MEIDDPLRQAAMNLQKLQRVEEEEKLELSPLNDIEKGSVHVEKQRRLLDTIKEKEEETRSRKVVVRIEIHDTGVGLKRRDVIEFVVSSVVGSGLHIAVTDYSHLMCKPKLAADRGARAQVSV